ncbi:uncharacterized protein [Phaseolus vulgaris]|uniref:uncharacterized protein n=1 Tax=Phaseolus vulgaris TaxID=3885 RepID=UPI0035CA55EA
MRETYAAFIFDGDILKFPLYWTQDPLKFNLWSCHSMNAADRHVIEVFGHISYRIPTRALLQLYTSKSPQEDLIALMAATNSKGRSYFTKLLNRAGDVTPRRKNVVKPVVEVGTMEPLSRIEAAEPAKDDHDVGP